MIHRFRDELNLWQQEKKKGDEIEYEEYTKDIPISEIPDLVVKMDSFFLTKGNNEDQFMMMKFPFELTEKGTFMVLVGTYTFCYDRPV